MKKLNYILIITLVLFCVTLVSFADDTKHDLSLTLGYYNNNNRLQYLMVHAKSKINKKFELIQGIKMRFYITDETPANLLGTAVTDNKSAKQSFIVVSEPAKNFDQTKGTADITKARIKIDTTADRKIVAVVTELKDSVWTPVKGVEMKIGIRRMSADLNVNETPTYTTDSLGTVSAEFKRDSLPGNAKGMLTLVAKIEDNDLYGNLTAELSSNWGAVPSYISEFDKRTLFARRGKSPIWLELIAYSIVASVWGVLLYLVGQIRKLKKMSTV
jgi:hypothetical protein